MKLTRSKSRGPRFLGVDLIKNSSIIKIGKQLKLSRLNQFEKLLMGSLCIFWHVFTISSSFFFKATERTKRSLLRAWTFPSGGSALTTTWRPSTWPWKSSSSKKTPDQTRQDLVVSWRQSGSHDQGGGGERRQRQSNKFYKYVYWIHCNLIPYGVWRQLHQLADFKQWGKNFALLSFDHQKSNYWPKFFWFCKPYNSLKLCGPYCHEECSIEILFSWM